MHVDDAPTSTPEEADMKIDYGEDDLGMLDDDDALMQDDAEVAATPAAAVVGGDGMLLDDSVAPTPTPVMDADEPEIEPGSEESTPAALSISLPPNTLVHPPPQPLSSSASAASTSSGPSYASIAPPPLPLHPGFSSPPLINVSDNELQMSALGHSAAAVVPLPLSSAPLINVSDNELQMSALGHSAAAVVPLPLSSAPFSLGVNHRAPIVSPTPNFDTTQVTASDHDDSKSPLPQVTHSSDATQQSLLDPRRALASQHQHSSDDAQTQNQAIEALGPGTTRIVQEQQLRQQSEDDDDVDGVAKQENEVIIRQGLDGHIVVETEQRNSVPPPSASASNASDDEQQRSGGQVRQINSVKVVEAVGASSGLLKRPLIDKAALEFFGLGDEAAAQVSEDDHDHETSQAAATDTEGKTTEGPTRPASRSAPTVLLQFGDDRYTMFRAASAVEEGQDAEELPILFGERKDHHLYYEQVEALFEALHASLPGLESKQAEYSLEIDGLGIILQEDNVYTREVSLHDFHRLYSGCGLPGRMLVKLAEREGPRFPTGFSALMQHIMRVADGREESHAVGEEEEEVYEEAEEQALVEGEGGDDGPGEVEGDGDETKGSPYDDGEWHETAEGGDEHSGSEEGAEVCEAAEEEEEEEEEEEAYEELNDGDLAAVVEGAQEDYVHVQGQVEETNGEALATNGEEVHSHAANGDEPVAAEARIPKSIKALRSEPLELSYDTPDGTGLELPAIPLDKPEAVVEAAAAPLEVNENRTAEGTVVEEFNGKTEVPANDHVVIDYDEVAVEPSMGEGGKRAHASLTEEDDARGADDVATGMSSLARSSSFERR
ncbi:BQ2448_8019 [Microbotryum intermedium]|uniref:BQ2448_8019 protein n=1 Tax=Microbotryum intermedium TaxID=269621 RepID=A0A238FMK2_9BASI|nr:BQ2448_8019 [Microbotryum intermedium]